MDNAIVDVLKQRHATYQTLRDEWQFFEDSYVGGKAYISAGYLDTHSLEKDEDYRNRVSRAYLYNFAQKVIDIYTSFIYKDAIPRKVSDPTLKLLLDDADRRGTTFAQFMKEHIAPASLYEGHMAVIVDIPREAQESKSKHEDEQNKIHPYCTAYSPMNVVDWSKVDGVYSWIRLKEDRPDTTGPLEKRDKQRYQYRTWTTESWYLHANDGTLLETGTNDLGKVPVVMTPVRKNRAYPDVGLSLIADIAHIQKAVFNYLSLLDEFFFKQAFNILAFPMDEENMDAEDVKKSIKEVGTTNGLLYPANGSPPSYIAPPTDSSKTIMEWIDKSTQKIIELAKLQDFSGEKKQQSGISKAFDFHDTNSAFAKIADNFEQAETEILKLAYEWEHGKEPDPGEIEIEYPDDFNIKQLSDEINDAIALLEMDISESFGKKTKKWIAHKAFPDMLDKESKQIDKEIDAAQPDPITPDPNLFADVKKSETPALVKKVVKNG